MRRLLFVFSTAISLLLFLATLGAWFYSYGDQPGGLRGKDSETRREISVYRGRLFYQAYWISEKIVGVDYEYESETEPWRWVDFGDGNTYHVGPMLKRKWLVGFGYDNYTYPYHRGSINFFFGNAHERTFWIPLWSLMAAFAVLPLAVVRRLWHYFRRPGPGFCSTCRYSLTGNVSGVCPECGAKISN